MTWPGSITATSKTYNRPLKKYGFLSSKPNRMSWNEIDDFYAILFIFSAKIFERSKQTAGGHARRWYQCLLKMNVYCAAIRMLLSKSDLKMIESILRVVQSKTFFLQVSFQKPSSNQSKNGKGEDWWSSRVFRIITGTHGILVAVVCKAVAGFNCCILKSEIHK